MATAKQNRAAVASAARSYRPNLDEVNRAISNVASIIVADQKIQQLENAPYDKLAERQAYKDIATAIERTAQDANKNARARKSYMETFLADASVPDANMETIEAALKHLDDYDIGDDRSGELGIYKNKIRRDIERRKGFQSRKNTHNEQVASIRGKLEENKKKEMLGYDQYYFDSNYNRGVNLAELDKLFDLLGEGVELGYNQKSDYELQQAKDLEKYYHLRNALQEFDDVNTMMEVEGSDGQKQMIDILENENFDRWYFYETDEEGKRVPKKAIDYQGQEINSVKDAIRGVVDLIKAGDIDKAYSMYSTINNQIMMDSAQMKQQAISNAKSLTTAAQKSIKEDLEKEENKLKEARSNFSTEVNGKIKEINERLKKSDLSELKWLPNLPTSPLSAETFETYKASAADRILNILAKSDIEWSWDDDEEAVAQKWKKEGSSPKEAIKILDQILLHTKKFEMYDKEYDFSKGIYDKNRGVMTGIDYDQGWWGVGSGGEDISQLKGTMNGLLDLYTLLSENYQLTNLTFDGDYYGNVNVSPKKLLLTEEDFIKFINNTDFSVK